MRKTSIESYQRIKELGLLRKLQFEVYDVVFRHGPITQGEAWQRFFPSRQRPTITPRFAELERLGVISSVGERPCAVTGRKAIVWDVTDRLPQKPPKVERKLCLFCQGKGHLD